MADIELDDSTKSTFEHLAEDAGLSVTEYLAQVAEEKRREHALNIGAAAFRRVTRDPATVAAFDAEFGGPTSATHAPPRAA
ncbi:antitoxin MazE7 [Streptomyces sp. FXJ1.4098]|nr:antitoxin MazE7 [Streptomyces sp. FXJ1.4098]